MFVWARNREILCREFFPLYGTHLSHLENILIVMVIDSRLLQFLFYWEDIFNFILLWLCIVSCLLNYTASHSKQPARCTQPGVGMHYHREGNFREVYILHSSRYDRICESLSRKFVTIAIQTHNTSTQIAKLIPRKCLFEREIAKFYAANFFHSTVHTWAMENILIVMVTDSRLLQFLFYWEDIFNFILLWLCIVSCLLNYTASHSKQPARCTQPGVGMHYHREGNFREVYISHSLRFDRIGESLSRELVNITIQTHNTSTQMAKFNTTKMFVWLWNCEILCCKFFPLYVYTVPYVQTTSTQRPPVLSYHY